MNRIFKTQLGTTLSLILLGFFLLLLRAWPRLFHPEVWIEDGSQNLTGFINEGVVNIFSPVGGYLVLVDFYNLSKKSYVGSLRTTASVEFFFSSSSFFFLLIYYI